MRVREAELIEGFLRGNSEDFHELIRPHERRAFLIAYSVLRNQHDAEDAVQQGLMKVFQNISQLQEIDKFPQWLMRIVENEARMLKRRLHQHLYQAFDNDVDESRQQDHFRPREFADWRDLPIETVELAEIRSEITKALMSLPETYREIFLLRDKEHMSMAEIADVLCISVPAVKTRLHRARLMMRELLTPVFAKPQVSIWERWKGVNPWSRAK